MACASNVFPHPGGPWSKNPLGGDTPSCLKISGCFMWTSSLQTLFKTLSQPPTSENVSFGSVTGTTLSFFILKDCPSFSFSLGRFLVDSTNGFSLSV